MKILVTKNLNTIKNNRKLVELLLIFIYYVNYILFGINIHNYWFYQSRK